MSILYFYYYNFILLDVPRLTDKHTVNNTVPLADEGNYAYC